MSATSTIAIRTPQGRTAWLSPSDLALYRGATLGLLRRYFRLSVEIGRLPSLLGRECFRAQLTSYQAQSFEDVVIFVHEALASREIMDEGKFKDGLSKIIDGVVACLNASVWFKGQ